MFFTKKTGTQRIEDALNIFSKATNELEIGVKLLDIEKEKEELLLENHEAQIEATKKEFKIAQHQREIDFSESQEIEIDLCQVTREKVEGNCKQIAIERNKATKVIDNINNLLN